MISRRKFFGAASGALLATHVAASSASQVDGDGKPRKLDELIGCLTRKAESHGFHFWAIYPGGSNGKGEPFVRVDCCRLRDGGEAPMVCGLVLQVGDTEQTVDDAFVAAAEDMDFMAETLGCTFGSCPRAGRVRPWDLLAS